MKRPLVLLKSWRFALKRLILKLLMKNKLIIIALFSIIQILAQAVRTKNHLILFLVMVL
jgi:hypothetical protein